MDNANTAYTVIATLNAGRNAGHIVRSSTAANLHDALTLGRAWAAAGNVTVTAFDCETGTDTHEVW